MTNVGEHDQGKEQQKRRLTANVLLWGGVTTGEKIRKEIGGKGMGITGGPSRQPKSWMNLSPGGRERGP